MKKEVLILPDGHLGVQKVNISLNGSFHTFQLGVKFNLGNLPEKNLQSKGVSFEKGTKDVSVMPGFILYPMETTYNFKHGKGSYKNKLSAFLPAIGIIYYLSNKNSIEGRINFHKLHTFTMSMDILNLSVGAAKRIKLPNELNLFNIHGGIALSKITGSSGDNESQTYYNHQSERDEYYSISYNSKTTQGMTKVFSFSGSDTLYSSFNTYGIEKSFIPAFYLGVSKDFRISDRIRIGISYFRNIGLRQFYKEETKTFDFVEVASGSSKTTMSGTASHLLFSMKYQLK